MSHINCYGYTNTSVIEFQSNAEFNPLDNLSVKQFLSYSQSNFVLGNVLYQYIDPLHSYFTSLFKINQIPRKSLIRKSTFYWHNGICFFRWHTRIINATFTTFQVERITYQQYNRIIYNASSYATEGLSSFLWILQVDEVSLSMLLRTPSRHESLCVWLL